MDENRMESFGFMKLGQTSNNILFSQSQGSSGVEGWMEMQYESIHEDPFIFLKGYENQEEAFKTYRCLKDDPFPLLVQVFHEYLALITPILPITMFSVRQVPFIQYSMCKMQIWQVQVEKRAICLSAFNYTQGITSQTLVESPYRTIREYVKLMALSIKLGPWHGVQPAQSNLDLYKNPAEPMRIVRCPISGKYTQPNRVSISKARGQKGLTISFIYASNI